MNLRNKLMLGCMVLLVVVATTILVRVTTAQVLVKKLHMDNMVTRGILWDVSDVFEVANGAPNVSVPWDKLYPFTVSREDNYTKITSRVRAIDARLSQAIKDKIEQWTSERLIKGRRIIEIGRQYDSLIGWNVVNPNLNIYTMQDKYLTFIYHKTDMKDRIKAVTELRDYATAQGAQFMFVQAPFKINKYGDAEVNGVIDFSNQNADELLAGLVANDVRVYDLRQAMGKGLSNDDYHALFPRTDHHWKMETALMATVLLGERLSDMGIVVDDSHWSLNDYSEERLEKKFLGSQGRKVTLAKAAAEDISFYHANFPSQIHLKVPTRGIDATGDLDILYDESRKKVGDIYYLPTYGTYAYGEVALLRVDNLLLDEFPEQKVLLIKDSFSDPVTIFLSMGIKHLITMDLRHFTGSLRSFINQERPDVIIVMYTPNYPGKSEPNADYAALKQFDFR